jgi:hypothetical protein
MFPQQFASHVRMEKTTKNDDSKAKADLVMEGYHDVSRYPLVI